VVRLPEAQEAQVAQASTVSNKVLQVMAVVVVLALSSTARLCSPIPGQLLEVLVALLLMVLLVKMAWVLVLQIMVL
jgi:hypothetical protein